MNWESRILRRRAWVLLGLMLCAAWAMMTWPRLSLAQRAVEEKAAAKEAVADEKPAAPEAKAVEGEAPAPARPAPAAATKETESFLHWVMRCSGFIGLVILLLSIYFVSTVGRLFWEMRVETAAPPEMVLQCESLLEQRDFKGIYNLVKEDDSFFSRAVDHGHYRAAQRLGRGPRGDGAGGRGDHRRDGEEDQHVGRARHAGADDRAAGHAQGDDRQLQRDRPQPTSQLKASEVAGGISEALLLTFEGVALSVPAIYFFALFRNRVVYIATSVMLTGGPVPAAFLPRRPGEGLGRRAGRRRKVTPRRKLERSRLACQDSCRRKSRPSRT